MKLILMATALSLLGGAAYAQTAAPAASETPMATTAGSMFYVVPAPVAGSVAMSHLASDLDDKDVYGANNEKIGEIEDFVITGDGTVAAAVIEVGGFLGVGEKDVLVNFDALKMVMDGNKMRIVAEGLTRESLTSTPDVDLDAVFPDHD